MIGLFYHLCLSVPLVFFMNLGFLLSEKEESELFHFGKYFVLKMDGNIYQDLGIASEALLGNKFCN